MGFWSVWQLQEAKIWSCEGGEKAEQRFLRNKTLQGFFMLG